MRRKKRKSSKGGRLSQKNQSKVKPKNKMQKFNNRW